MAVSIYADDVVPIFKVEEQELLVIRHILSLFGGALGLKVNYRKTTAALIRGDEQDRDRVH